VSITVRRPSESRLRELLAAARSSNLTYEPAGIVFSSTTPRGWRRHRRQVTLDGDCFDIARRALRDWNVHRGAGLDVCAEAPAAVGVHVAMCARVAGVFVEITCRVISVIDEPDRWGFAYGTLPVHPERGEEAFVVSRSGDGVVTFSVDAVSEPIEWLASLVRPLADRLQLAATDRYLRAMTRLTTT